MLTSPDQCPHCRYDLSGIIATWTHACPLEQRCPECGNTFDVARLRSPRHWPVAGATPSARPCPKCGYDLAGIAHSNPGYTLVTCSECGHSADLARIHVKHVPTNTTRSPLTNALAWIILAPFIAFIAFLALAFLIGFLWSLTR